jgi:hypothetical protein
MKNAINNIFDKGRLHDDGFAEMRLLIDKLDDARASIDPNAQIKDLMHRISRELREGLDWVSDHNSLAMAVVLIGISLNEVIEVALNEDSGISDSDLASVYPSLIETWLIGISKQLGAEIEE